MNHHQNFSRSNFEETDRQLAERLQQEERDMAALRQSQPQQPIVIHQVLPTVHHRPYQHHCYCSPLEDIFVHLIDSLLVILLQLQVSWNAFDVIAP